MLGGPSLVSTPTVSIVSLVDVDSSNRLSDLFTFTLANMSEIDVVLILQVQESD